MKWLQTLPPGVRSFLLRQPLPDHWLAALRAQACPVDAQEPSPKEQKPHSRDVEYTPIEFKWNRSWDKALSLAVLLISAIIMYLIVR